jgi:YVTN family beta-propeller protein
MFRKITFHTAMMFVAAATLSLTSCNKDDNSVEISKKGPYSNGIFITNEGNFFGNNGSVSFYSFGEDTANGILADTVYNDIFSEVNGYDLGDVVQSVTVYDSLAFIVVNNSNKVEVVTFADFVEKDVINEVNQPRYIVVNGTTAYVSAWGDGGVVYVVDLTDFSVTKSIKVGNGPEKMLIDENRLYVANSGGLLSDSTISIIDMSLNKVVDSIVVGGNPKAFVKDKNGNIWVFCNGIVEYSQINYPEITYQTPSLLVKINNNDEIVNTIKISDTEHPLTIDINPGGDSIYYGGGFKYIGIKRISIDASSNNSINLTDDAAYSFMIDPNTGELFVFIASSWTENGVLKRYTGNGDYIKSYMTGIGPNGGASSKRAGER